MKWIIVWAAALLAYPAAAELRIIDGDTFELDGVTYRLNGVDAPEFGQQCQSKAGLWNCGAEALQALMRITDNAEISCEQVSADPYGRVIGTCTANGKDIAASLVTEGHAWAFVKYSDLYLGQEAEAKAKALGIWSGENQPAWEFREAAWAEAAPKAPDGCPIKGNISENGKIYHAPWSPWYTRTRISLSKGERWFCDEAEAVAAGWRAPHWP